LSFQLLAAAELEAADAAIRCDDQCPGLGDDFLAELQKAFDRIRDTPQRFSVLEHYAGPHEIRRCLLGRFPYVVIFLCRSQDLLVVAISHVRRRPLYWLERLA
jgi:hypothetical protein